jgi:tetratricopeptide (TPR) repeat protein
MKAPVASSSVPSASPQSSLNNWVFVPSKGESDLDLVCRLVFEVAQPPVGGWVALSTLEAMVAKTSRSVSIEYQRKKAERLGLVELDGDRTRLKRSPMVAPSSAQAAVQQQQAPATLTQQPKVVTQAPAAPLASLAAVLGTPQPAAQQPAQQQQPQQQPPQPQASSSTASAAATSGRNSKQSALIRELGKVMMQSVKNGPLPLWRAGANLGKLSAELKHLFPREKPAQIMENEATQFGLKVTDGVLHEASTPSMVVAAAVALANEERRIALETNAKAVAAKSAAGPSSAPAPAAPAAAQPKPTPTPTPTPAPAPTPTPTQNPTTPTTQTQTPTTPTTPAYKGNPHLAPNTPGGKALTLLAEIAAASPGVLVRTNSKHVMLIRQAELAASSLAAARNKDPFEASLWLLGGKLAIALGLTGEALEFLSTCLDIKRERRALMLRASIYAVSEDASATALEDLAEALLVENMPVPNPENLPPVSLEDVHRARLDILRPLKRWKEALVDLEALAKALPKDASVARQLCQCRLALGLDAEPETLAAARRAYDLTVDPADREGQDGYQLARALTATEKYKEALDIADPVAKAHPKAKAVLYMKALLLRRRGEAPAGSPEVVRLLDAAVPAEDGEDEGPSWYAVDAAAVHRLRAEVFEERKDYPSAMKAINDCARFTVGLVPADVLERQSAIMERLRVERLVKHPFALSPEELHGDSLIDCPICLGLPEDAVIADDGRSYCDACLKSLRDRSNAISPNTKEKILRWCPNYPLRNLVKRIKQNELLDLQDFSCYATKAVLMEGDVPQTVLGSGTNFDGELFSSSKFHPWLAAADGSGGQGKKKSEKPALARKVKAKDAILVVNYEVKNLLDRLFEKRKKFTAVLKWVKAKQDKKEKIEV